MTTGPPPPAAPGQVIILAERRFSDGAWAESCRGTVERHGLIVIDSVANDGRAGFQDYVIQQRADFAAGGPSWDFPTPERLAGLDPSAANLGKACGARCPSVDAATCGAQCQPTEDLNCGDQCHLLDLPRYLEWQTWSAVEALAAKGDVVLPPPVRAGLLRLLGTLDRVTAYETTVDGRVLRVVGFADETSIRELYVDPAGGRFAGAGSVVTAQYPDTAQCPHMWHEDGGPMPTLGPECFVAAPLTEPVRASITFWEQTVQTP